MTTRFYDTMVGLGPLHWWRFHEANAALEDDIGSASDSNFTGSVATITSRDTGPLEATETTYAVTLSGGGYLVRGSKQWNANEFAGTTDGSIVLWFKTSYSAASQFMVGQHPGSYAFQFFLTAAGAIFVQAINNFAPGVREITSDTSGYNDGNWHLFAFTGDGTNPNRMYIDGSEIAYSTTFTSGTGLTSYFWQQATTGNFRVGQSPRLPAIDVPFTGSFSELAFFSYPLSASEVYSLWEASQPYSPPSPGTGGRRYKGRRTFAGF